MFWVKFFQSYQYHISTSTFKLTTQHTQCTNHQIQLVSQSKLILDNTSQNCWYTQSILNSELDSEVFTHYLYCLVNFQMRKRVKWPNSKMGKNSATPDNSARLPPGTSISDVCNRFDRWRRFEASSSETHPQIPLWIGIATTVCTKWGNHTATGTMGKG